MVLLEVKMQGSILISPDQLCEGLHKALILYIMGSSTTKKSSNKQEFFVAVTSLNKIGEGKIRDLTGDILFPVTFKCAILTVIRKEPRHYWCIMSNNILVCIEKRAGLPCTWTEVLSNELVILCLRQWK